MGRVVGGRVHHAEVHAAAHGLTLPARPVPLHRVVPRTLHPVDQRDDLHLAPPPESLPWIGGEV